MSNSITLFTKDIAYRLPNHSKLIIPPDINLMKGEMNMLTGVSGSGKTCFLDVLQGVITLERGVIKAEANMVRIYQDLRLVREHTALRNVLDGMLGKRKFISALFPSLEDRERALLLLEKLGLKDKALQPVFSLSVGEAQRVAFARAMIAKPKLLVADEPFSALDKENTAIIMEVLEQECQERGMSVLIVTHKVPRSTGKTPLHIIPFNPKLEAYKRKKSVKEKVITNNSSHLLSRRGSFLAIILFALLSALWLIPDLNAGNFSWKMVGSFLLQWFPSASELEDMPWAAIFSGLADTLAMASFATIIAVFLSLPIAILATKGFMPNLVALPVRYALNWWRAIPSIIWALVCVAAVGLGTLSGLVALVLYSMGYLTKFFYECFEQVDKKPAESLVQLGAKRSQVIILALWPMTLRSITSSSLFMLEYNVRAASILGIVGAGGIGVLLKESVEWSNWHVVGTIIFFMGFMVIAIDSFSSWLRRSLTPDRKQAKGS